MARWRKGWKGTDLEGKLHFGVHWEMWRTETRIGGEVEAGPSSEMVCRRGMDGGKGWHSRWSRVEGRKKLRGAQRSDDDG
jgi:hypothetical protein